MLIMISLLLLNANIIAMDSDKEHDINFRNLYCNTENRRAVPQLPQHLIDACEKMNVDPQDIHVFQEPYNGNYLAFTVGKNIVLKKNFWNLYEKTQAWYFAHELSHVKHQDTKNYWDLQKNLVDFHIGSSIAVEIQIFL